MKPIVFPKLAVNKIAPPAFEVQPPADVSSRDEAMQRKASAVHQISAQDVCGFVEKVAADALRASGVGYAESPSTAVLNRLQNGLVYSYIKDKLPKKKPVGFGRAHGESLEWRRSPNKYEPVQTKQDTKKENSLGVSAPIDSTPSGYKNQDMSTAR